MFPALVLLLVYNLCCTHADTFPPERMDGTIGHDLLQELLKRMDAKDEEINELRGNMNTLRIQIGAQDVTINELRKKVHEHENAVSVMEQNQKRQDTNSNKLITVVENMQLENVQLRKSYSKCARKIQKLHVLIKNVIETDKMSQTFGKEKTLNHFNDDTNASDVNDDITSNKSESSITGTHIGLEAIAKNQKGRDVNAQADVKRHAGTDLVAFFATLTNHAMNLGVDQNVKFDNIITNFGPAYTQLVGAFFAPVSGVYVFMSTLLSYGGHTGHFGLTRNGNVVCSMYVAGNADASGSSYVLYLKNLT